MQETTTRTSEGEDPPTQRPKWVRIVAIAVALAMLAGFVIAAVQSVTGTEAQPAPDGDLGADAEPDFSLSDEEAIATFRELHGGLVNAVQGRDISLLPSVATDDGPIFESASEEIRDLKRSGVIDQARIRIMNAIVASNNPDEVVLEALFEVQTCFVNEEGDDVTTGPAAIEQELTWTLRIEDSRWQIHEGILDDDRELPGKNGTC